MHEFIFSNWLGKDTNEDIRQFNALPREVIAGLMSRDRTKLIDAWKVILDLPYSEFGEGAIEIARQFTLDDESGNTTHK